MTPEALLDYCLSLPAASAYCPFGPEPICARVGGHIFAEIYPSEARRFVTLKCEPALAELFRTRWPDDVRGGYHCPETQRRHRNTVRLEGAVPDDEILAMVERSYRLVVASLTRAERAGMGEER